MASQQKILISHWVNSQGERIPPRMPGATRISEKSARWDACWREGHRRDDGKRAWQVMTSSILFSPLSETAEMFM